MLFSEAFIVQVQINSENQMFDVLQHLISQKKTLSYLAEGVVLIIHGLFFTKLQS